MLFSLPIEFWIASQVIMDMVLLVVILLVLKRNPQAAPGQEAALSSLSRILEPVLTEARALAETFDGQLNEKRGIIRMINQDLDTRIISLNLLLNRAESCLNASGAESSPGEPQSEHVVDLQQRILSLAAQDEPPAEIARKLKVSRGEVDMVISLKRKFDQMGGV